MAAVKEFPPSILLSLSLADQEVQAFIRGGKVGFRAAVNLGAAHFRDADYVRAFTWWSAAAEMRVPKPLRDKVQELADSMWGRIQRGVR